MGNHVSVEQKRFQICSASILTIGALLFGDTLTTNLYLFFFLGTWQDSAGHHNSTRYRVPNHVGLPLLLQLLRDRVHRDRNTPVNACIPAERRLFYVPAQCFKLLECIFRLLLSEFSGDAYKVLIKRAVSSVYLANWLRTTK